ncbi:MAG TPA: phosphoribosyltransferase family protein [Patescibacteria group bacterium]|nr:phosphoribosyltransferase family protein [Patescibacteria group bacterium]
MFKDRENAAKKLAQSIQDHDISLTNAVVIGITRGGAVVGKIVAEELGLLFDIIVIKKIGSPHNPELAIGAVGPKNTTYYNKAILSNLHILPSDLLLYSTYKQKERISLEEKLRVHKKPVKLFGKDVVVVDDGVATGASVFCALESIAKQKPARTILAVPVISSEIQKKLASKVDMLLALVVAKQFEAVGNYYQKFPEVDDDEVMVLLSSKQ